MAYQMLGQESKYASAGETVVFQRGTPHKFWAAGNENRKVGFNLQTPQN
jgi:hypothetical protein